ncbi:beta and beta-prime subunits of DNA dependent RNA-polymerase [Punctularia strigosozonata HHB-11173 SS5]|uniref:beta and beta-prime subunits of DNA dependent RNA-polymerase n=1 Tax=Punctularia strigosozonata (strain HHB-11173) TaxID=741275 RepID=UPI0004417A73|nr:beta and beta-prime subunits of DNA dependent RNA-polymerase [Punctularia strigosozonata HHB-11173 SS5]EIN10167.1 beta and beta-prime subunits of DNA dependent RNA-polymerase [Punctularia strigosozonata HHB-11173 SS5]
MKDTVSHQAPKVIKKLRFTLLNAQDTVKLSEFEVTHRDLYTALDRTPVKNGVLDRRLGTSEKNAFCETCGLSYVDCVGHYAYIKLVVPVFHIGYFKHTIAALQCICKTCARVLLEEPDRRTYLKRFRRPNLENLQRQALCKAVNSAARKVVYCPYCAATNGTVKKAGALKIIHDKFRAKKTAEEMERWKKTFSNAVDAQKELATYIGRAVHEDLNPLKVLDLFRRISDEDCELLGMKPEQGRPEEFIWQYISVPPVAIRPSVAQDGASNEDDLTVKLTEIVFTNALIKQGLAKGAPTPQFMEQWEFLQLSVAMYINSELPGVPSQMGQKPIRGFCQRLKGKQGRFRGNLSGKRVDFSGRTVISPDPNLRIDEVAVPERVAKILTYPERVTAHNIEKLRQAVRNGCDIHPGANYVTAGSSGFKKFLKFGKRDAIADGLRIGDIVERHIIDGDIVLFNRQPSLHKLSIMCHRVKVRPWRTFRLNECVCGPYNADFDGDEMNLHVPQTEEARTEALELMNIKHNLVSPRNGEPVIAAIQDFITASFLLSQRDRFFDRSQFTQVCSYFADANLHIDIPPPTIWKPQRLWTGKQVFNVLMRPNKKSNILVNVESKCNKVEAPKAENYPKRMKPINDLAPNDGWLVVVNSEIMCGVMDKATLGSGKKKSIFGVILRDYGPHEAAAAMNRVAKLSARWLANYGFSLGINDVIPGPVLFSKKDQLVEKAYAACLDLIARAKKGLLENKAGCNQEQTLEAMISSVLSKVRDEVGEICLKELSRYNAPLIMATCGSKGSVINVAQMVACVGQQIIAGHRVPDGFQDRSLPHFPKKSREPPSKGFVRNSFYSGLLPTEFLFHAISGREGLVDTAVKTAETGYMQRRLMKALEDLTTHYDLTVRNAIGGIVQFRYGDDGLDPACLEGDAQPLDMERAWTHARSISSRAGRSLLPYEVLEITDAELSQSKFVSECTAAYRATVRGFVTEHIAHRLAEVRRSRGMFDALEREDEWDSDTDLSMGADVTEKAYVENKSKVTEDQLRMFLQLCWVKYVKAKIEPGSTVGAVGAQSIGEPGTQMTLKTFHFAGVASMNVTLGVPRIKEIINAAKVISTPIISCKLVTPNSEPSARIVKGRLEKTHLGDVVAAVLEEAWAPEYTYIGVIVDTDAIQKLQLELTLDDIKWAIVNAKKLKIKQESITVIPRRNRLRIYIDGIDKYYRLRELKRQLPDVVVKGVPSIRRAVINIKEKDDPKGKKGDNELLVEGYGLQKVMTTEGIVGEHTSSNHIIEVAQVLGIEASRRTIINEIQYTMVSHGMSIDPRHITLLGDVMTYKGEVLGITRFGVAKMKDSVLMLASFEKTTDHLFDASAYGKNDSIAGVSESIIMGNPAANCGTSLPALVTPAPNISKPRKLLFEGAL